MLRLRTIGQTSSAPVPLLREMTSEEVAAKATKQKKMAPSTTSKVGVAGAMHVREVLMEKAGHETAASKKRKKKEEISTGDKANALKIVRGGHLLK